MTTNNETVVEKINRIVEPLTIATPEYILPLLTNLRDELMKNRWARRVNADATAIGLLNIVILNVELMIENNSKKL